jgi:hypothetical protein
MSTPTKLRPGESELTKLKGAWRGLSEDARSFWQELFVSQTPQSEIRRQLLAKLKINLRRDNQLNAFRDWELEQRAMDLEAERKLEDERRLVEQFGDKWTLDQIREEVIKKSYARALADGNFCQGLKTVKADLSAKQVLLDERRLVLLEKKAAAYDRAQAAIAEARSSKGGITPETFKRIETELKLL